VNVETARAPRAGRGIQHGGGPISSGETAAAIAIEMISFRAIPRRATGDAGGHVAETT